MKLLVCIFLITSVLICNVLVAQSKNWFLINNLVDSTTKALIKYSEEKKWRLESSHYYRPNDFYEIKSIGIYYDKKSERNTVELNHSSTQSRGQSDCNWTFFKVKRDTQGLEALHSFKNYFPRFIDSINLSIYKISDTIFKCKNFSNNQNVFNYHFPDSIGAYPNRILVLTRSNIIVLGKDLLDKELAYRMKRMSYMGSFSRVSILNPAFSSYDPSIFSIWGNYVSKFFAIPNYNYIKEKRVFSYKKKYKKDVRRLFKRHHNLAHESYFEFILWQVYKPSNLKLNDNVGKVRSFLFNSNNPNYPGNYEVKFNIYEPYRFKVFKR